MTRWHELSAQGRATVAAGLEALALEDTLPEPGAGPSGASEATALHPRMAELYAYAVGRAAPDAARRVERAAARSGRVGDDLRRLLARTAGDVAPRAAAAASDTLTERRGRRFVLRVRHSTARPEHAYVVVKLDDPDSRPERLIVCAGDGSVYSRPLPQPKEGTLQLLEPRDGAFVAALGDPASEIYLR